MIITNAVIITTVLLSFVVITIRYLAVTPPNRVKRVTEDMSTKEIARHIVRDMVAIRFKLGSCLFATSLCVAINVALAVSNYSAGRDLMVGANEYSYELTFNVLTALSLPLILYYVLLSSKLRRASLMLELIDDGNGMVDNVLDEEIAENEPEK